MTKNYVKYIVCPICDDGYYINTEGDYTHVEVCQFVCNECASLCEPEPFDILELEEV
jgi:hypothetical protein